MLLIGTSAVFVRSWVGDGSDAESLTAFVEASSSSWSIPALLIGLSLIVTSRLAEQANRDLYEAELQPPLKELSAEFGNVADLARYPGSLVTDVVGVAGVALVTAAVVALAANLT